MAERESDPARREPDAPTPEDEPRFHRRGFFTEGLRQFLRPLAEVVADQVSERFERAGFPLDEDGPEPLPGATPPPPTVEVPDRKVLRPPGALPGEEFLDRCISSGQCVAACPVAAIHLARSEDPRLDEKPFIDPEVQACVVCDDLSCMKACPSGALESVPREEIRMGLAVVDDDTCVRSQGEDCQICVDKCPLGRQAIEIPEEGASVRVHADGCTGCGVCQMYCPTDPRAIVVVPPEPAGHGGPEGPAPDGEVSGSYLPFDSPPPEDGDD